MIIKSGVIRAHEHLYTIIICTDGVVYIHSCLLLVTCVVTAVCEYMWILLC